MHVLEYRKRVRVGIALFATLAFFPSKGICQDQKDSKYSPCMVAHKDALPGEVKEYTVDLPTPILDQGNTNFSVVATAAQSFSYLYKKENNLREKSDIQRNNASVAAYAIDASLQESQTAAGMRERGYLERLKNRIGVGGNACEAFRFLAEKGACDAATFEGRARESSFDRYFHTFLLNQPEVLDVFGLNREVRRKLERSKCLQKGIGYWIWIQFKSS